jgi:hypothetical protein
MTFSNILEFLVAKDVFWIHNWERFVVLDTIE